jgi:hypothetical protein
MQIAAKQRLIQTIQRFKLSGALSRQGNVAVNKIAGCQGKA